MVDIKPEDIKEKGRLRPGNIFYVDLKNGRVLPDKEMKEEICSKRRYRQWLDRQVQHQNHLVTWICCISPCARRF